MSASTDHIQFGSSYVPAQSSTPPPPFSLSFSLSVSGENPNQSSFGQLASTLGQAVPAVGQPVPTAIGTRTSPTNGKPKSRSSMEKPKDASSSSDGKHCIETKTRRKVKKTDIDTLISKLNHSDYYTKPTIQELAAKETAEPGYCGRVNDLIIGRRGVGSIKFLGETDVREVNPESCIRFFKGGVIYKSIHSGGTSKNPTCHIFSCHIIATSTKQKPPIKHSNRGLGECRGYEEFGAFENLLDSHCLFSFSFNERFEKIIK